jgi:hypothetical protein
MQAIVLAALWPILFSFSAPAPNPGESPVVVELFTSEGCSSCPSADALLSKLRQSGAAEGSNILILGEHVDYWDHLGWSDRFASAALTRRQADYARRFDLDSTYTPQMVIDGRIELVGNDERNLRRQLGLAARSPKPAQISLGWRDDDYLTIGVNNGGMDGGKVFLALTEDGLSTKVEKGENGGRTLRHDGVVRNLQDIGSLDQGKFSTTIKTLPQRDWKTENLRAVVFVQKSGNREIIGAASIAFTHVH